MHLFAYLCKRHAAEADNHPSPQGSYAAALVVYAGLTKADPGDVTFVPSGLRAEKAALLRRRVRTSLQTRQMAGFEADQDRFRLNQPEA